jgi:hypothetical protein
MKYKTIYTLFISLFCYQSLLWSQMLTQTNCVYLEEGYYNNTQRLCNMPEQKGNDLYFKSAKAALVVMENIRFTVGILDQNLNQKYEIGKDDFFVTHERNIHIRANENLCKISKIGSKNIFRVKDYIFEITEIDSKGRFLELKLQKIEQKLDFNQDSILELVLEVPNIDIKNNKEQLKPISTFLKPNAVNYIYFWTSGENVNRYLLPDIEYLYHQYKDSINLIAIHTSPWDLNKNATVFLIPFSKPWTQLVCDNNEVYYEFSMNLRFPEGILTYGKNIINVGITPRELKEQLQDEEKGRYIFNTFR